MHVGRAKPREVARLFTEPYAVLNELGLNVAKGTPVRIHANQEVLPDIRRAVVIIIIIWDDGSVTVIVVHSAE